MMVTDGVMIAADDRWAVRSRVRTWLGSCSRWRRRLSTTTAPCPLAGMRHVLGGIEGERPYRTVSLTKRIEGERLSPASMWRSGGSCANTMAAARASCVVVMTSAALNKLDRHKRAVELAGRASAADRTAGTGRRSRVISNFIFILATGPADDSTERRASTFQDDLRVRNRNVLYLFRFRRSAVEHVVGVSVSRLTNFVADDR
jgi:hypothetical protein